jgi:adenosine deaminase
MRFHRFVDLGRRNGDSELAELAQAGVDASFAPDDLKSRLRGGIAAWLSTVDSAAAP